MLGTLPLIAMRQEHDETRILTPLRLAGGDELVDHRLRDVDEIPELRFPQDKIRGACGNAEPVFEAQHGRLGERAVVDLEGRARLRTLCERRVLLAGIYVVENRLAMRERPSFRVLTREANAHAVREQRRKCERLGMA